jgi:hypothetical protein
VVFVDVDGVLNGYNPVGIVRGELVARLARTLWQLPQPTVTVLSSNWRRKKSSRQRVNEAFLEHGVPLPISCTPCLVNRETLRHAPRPNEILHWLASNTHNVAQGLELDFGLPEYEDENFRPEHHFLPARIYVSHFCSLDDINFTKEREGGPFRDRILTHWVHTLWRQGLTEENAQQLIALLTGGRKPIPNQCENCGSAVRPLLLDEWVNKYLCGEECQRELWEKWRPELWKPACCFLARKNKNMKIIESRHYI